MSAPCGTYAAYQRHKVRGEPPCAGRRETHRVWMRNYRASKPSLAIAGFLQKRAYTAASRRLREAHRAEFDRIYAEELGTVSEP